MNIQHTNNGIIINDRQCFDVTATVTCGQLFRYQQLGSDKYMVYSWDKYCVIEQCGDNITIFTEDCEYWHDYFDLSTDYMTKCQQLGMLGNDTIKQICQYSSGIRILRQHPVEAIISFIISANNNIVRIKSIVDKICRAIGNEIEVGKYAFPTLQQLADCPVEQYAKLGCGYRAPYIQCTASQLLHQDITLLGKLDSNTARQQLLAYKGIGPKVADCILLFGYHKGDVVPVDTWVRKIYHKYYEQGHKDKDIASYLCSLWQDNAGIMQQYLFYFERSVDKSTTLL